jgi:hypothetical protein
MREEEGGGGCTPDEKFPPNRTESAVVLIPVLNRENRILQPNEDNCSFGTDCICLFLGVSVPFQCSQTL